MNSTAPLRPVTPVGILSARLDGVIAQAAKLGYDAPLFVDELRLIAALAQGLDPYLARHTTPASPALTRLAADTAAQDWNARFAQADTGRALESEMLSGHIEGQTLKMLVAATGARSVLEVGLFTGYSALAMAEGLPADGKLVACEIDDFAADFAARHFEAAPHGDKITIRRGPAADTLAQLADEGALFDFVFIDADKPGYIGYLEQILNTLLARNALICIDNTLMQGEPYLDGPRSANGDAIAAFNTAVVNDTRLESVLLPLRDGLTLLRRIDD